MRRPLTKAALGVAVLTLGSAIVVSAQGDRDPAAAPESRTRAATGSPLWKELNLDLEAARSPLSRSILSVLSEANLRALVGGEDPAKVVTLTGRSLAEELQAKALGGERDELVYTPIDPCRMVDTRNAGGAFAPGETRGYDLIGPTDYSSLGGEAAGCNIPTTFGGGVTSSNRVRGLVLNVVAVFAKGLGNFQAWATNHPPPTASVINFGTAQNIANGIALKSCDAYCLDPVPPFTCGDSCPGGDDRQVHVHLR